MLIPTVPSIFASYTQCCCLKTSCLRGKISSRWLALKVAGCVVLSSKAELEKFLKKTMRHFIKIRVRKPKNINYFLFIYKILYDLRKYNNT